MWEARGVLDNIGIMGSLKFALLVGMSVLGLSSFAAEECRENFRQQALKTSQAKTGKPLTMDAYLKRRYFVPLVAYTEEVSVRLCEIERKRKIWKGPIAKDVFCPKLKTNYKVECFRDWVSHQKINYAVEAPQLAAMAVELALIDKQNPGVDGSVLTLLMVDASLASFEPFNVAGNVLSTFSTSDAGAIAEIEKMREEEWKLFQQGRDKLVVLASSKLGEVKAAIARRPANADAIQTRWLNQTVTNLEQRVNILKARRG